MSRTEEIKGFQVIPVTLSASRYFKTEEPIKHYMYAKKHQSNTDKEIAERSIFLINPPINASLSTIRVFFKKISPESLIENFLLNIENLDYDINLTKLTSDLYDDEEINTGLRLPSGSSLVVFVDKSAANLALSKLKKYSRSKDLYEWNSKSEEPASVRFIKKFKSEILPLEETSEFVSKELQEFENRELESKKNLQEMKTLVDEDGFTLVVGKNRKTKKGILGKISGATDFHKQDTDKKMKKKEKQDFYRFQLRERKKLEMNELLKKFKDDQERIKELKEKKRFRPY
ncbi:hypothetical protein WICMUC_003862 [Wickerhamomyces mucosus]|uniref:Ribosomal RNA-processing protein 7 C-terminal domain-containing protein n=1 Tax=Wickerhamomyces mucosus TaxID=1378264 RepID=A0A9P8PKV4_9ASCO|nr:hypothetical protein WICMUC_003862 [Wickerhamomyces mucosus]